MSKNHNSKKFRVMRSVCLWLHDFICYNCKNHYDNLQVHHLNHNSADNRLNNLVPLCSNCHSIFHKIPVQTAVSKKDIITALLRKIEFFTRSNF